MRNNKNLILFAILILLICSFTYNKLFYTDNLIYARELNAEFSNNSPQFNSKSISHIKKYLEKWEPTTEYNANIQEISNTIIPRTTLYFSTSGKDSNNGLSPHFPKKNPLPFIESGNYTILLKGGDVFNIDKTIHVGSNVRVSTYGAKKRACFSFIQQSTNSFQVFDLSKNIYCVKLNENDKDAGGISIDGAMYWKKLLTNSLNNEDEYWIDPSNGLLYLKSSKNINGKFLKYSIAGNGFFLSNGSNCSIENLEINGCGRHGISIVSYSNILINNCFVHDIGGAIHNSTGVKFGNGIQIWATDSHNIIIANNTVNNCFDAGLSVQIDNSQINDGYEIYFINNYVDCCNYGFECFQAGLMYDLHDIVVSNNIFFDMKDITDGYRLTNYSNDYTSYLCLWYCDNNKDNILIKNNIGFKTQKYAITFAYDSHANPYVFENNLLQATDRNFAIKNEHNYTGDYSQIDCTSISNDDYKFFSDYFSTKLTM